MFRILCHTSGSFYSSLGTLISRRSFAHTIDKLPVGSEEPRLIPNTLDLQVLDIVRSNSERRTSLKHILDQYATKARTVLDITLAYESSPSTTRRIDFDSEDTGVTLLSHVVDLGQSHKVTFCSGFAIKPVDGYCSGIIVSCAHTLEEMQQSWVMKPDIASTRQSATLVFSRKDRASPINVEPALEVLASLPRSDLILFATKLPSLRTLPISPYPVPAGTRVRAHFVSEKRPTQPGWRPWIHGTWCKWVPGTVLGYRDSAGREAEPGTYDTLSHLLFDPPPLPGSSGGPIVAEETGSVVGVVLGSRMYNRIEGVRGWGVPSEVIYEMFRLPGLELEK